MAKKMKCPECGKGQVVRTVIKKFDTKLGGIPFTISNAEVWQCSDCGHIVATAQDLRSWREAQKTYLHTHRILPTPEEISEMRKSFGLSVADLATLMAVTRQTVHAWERPGLNALQAGPAALLLRLLVRTTSRRGLSGLIKELALEAQERGQSTAKISQLIVDQKNEFDVEPVVLKQAACSNTAYLEIGYGEKDGLAEGHRELTAGRIIRDNGSIWSSRAKGIPA